MAMDGMWGCTVKEFLCHVENFVFYSINIGEVQYRTVLTGFAFGVGH